MALLWLEGFEWSNVSAAAADVATAMSRYYSSVDIPAAGTPVVATRTGYVGLQLPIGDSFATPFLREPDDADNTCIFGFYLKTGTNFANLQDFIYIRTATVIHCGLEWNSDGTLDFQLGTSGSLDTSTFAFATNTEYYVEFKIVIGDGTNGSLEMRVADLTSDEDAVPTTEWTVANVDTRNSTHANETSWNRVHFLSNPTSGNFVFDDIYVCDGSGTKNNDFLGNLSVDSIDPNGAGFSSQLTPSAGSNFQNVDDADDDGSDDDTTYNTADANGEIDLYAMSPLVATGNPVGVQVQALTRGTQGDPRKFRILVRQGGTTEEGSDFTCLNDTYTSRFRVIEVNPSTGLAWTSAEVDLMECGIKRQS
jgi:hypothetical protein